MRERDRTQSIQKKKLLRTTFFSVALLVVATMILSSAAPAINVNVNSTQLNNMDDGQEAPLFAGDGSADLAGEPTGEPTVNTIVGERQYEHQALHRGVVVYDNTLNWYTLTSNQDDEAYGIDSEGADDFSFYTGGEDVCIQDVHWVGGSWGGSGYVDANWVVKFFEDDGTGNAPGALYAGPFTIVNPKKVLLYNSGTTYYYEFSADIEEVCFPGCGEKFWIDIFADHDYPPQYGWAAHYSPILGHPLMWKCPYFGYPDWVDGAIPFGLDLDYAFQLTQKADHDVSVIDINTGEFCECLPLEVVVTNYGKFDEVDVPVHVQITQEYAMYDEFYFDWTYDAYWYEVYYSDGGVSPHSMYYFYKFQAAAGTYYADCFDTFDFSEACNPMVTFWMWHDNLGSYDYIQVTANGNAVGPQFYRSNGDQGWVQHQVAIPIGTTTIGFVGVADSIFDAYPIYIDDVAVIDMVYDETILVDIDVGEDVTVAFPDYCPCQWHVVEDVTIDVDITACTEMVGDQTAANDCLTVPASVYLPLFHDVAGVDLTIEDQGCLEFDVCATIANLGQYEECCFKTYVNIWEFMIGPWTSLYSQDFQVYVSPLVAGWQRTHTNWARYYTSILGLGYSYTLRFSWSPSFVGTSRAYMTVPVSTAGLYELEINYRDYLDHFGGPYTLAFQTSTDGVNWVSAYEFVNPTGWTARDNTFVIPVNGASQMYFAFAFIGDTYNTDYWYIDNLVIKGRSGNLGDLDYSEWYCIDTIDICEELEFCLDSWVPSQPWPDCGSKLYKACVNTELCDPMDENPANDEYCEFIEVDFWHDIEVEITSPEKARNIAYGNDAYPGYNMVSFDLATPGTFTILGPYTGANFLAGGTWYDDKWWGSDYGAATLYNIDTTTGAMTAIGGSGTAYNGISVDPTTDTMYGASSYNLYTIDMGTGAQTLVGSWGSSYLMIDIAFGNDGTLYGHDIITDSMYIINKATGAATLLGSTGQVCNYAQGMEYDRDNDILYAAAYTSTGTLFTVDTATGLFTLVGTFAGGAEVDGLAIPGEGDGTTLPKPDIWIQCGEETVCATVTNLGVFDEVDDPSTPCDWEGITVSYELYWYYLDDPCEDPIVELVGEGMEQIELLCGEEYEVCFDYDFQETGVYQFIVTAAPMLDCDWDNNEDTLNIGVDCCDPISEHTLTPIMPDGDNNWYKQDVTVKITAYDPLCPDPCYGTSSKLKEIHYVINGVETVKADDEVTFKLKDEGVNLVEYWAVDNAGNVEDKFTFEIAIDKTAPKVDMFYERIEDGTVQIEFTAAIDEATSGIDHVEFYIGDTLTKTYTEGPYTYTVTWQASYKTTNFIFKAYDGAGNVGQASIYGGDIDMVRPRTVQGQSQAQGQAQIQQIVAQQI